MIAAIEAGVRALGRYLDFQGVSLHAWNASILDEAAEERRVVEYTLDCRSSGSDSQVVYRWIGKFYSDDSGQATFRNMLAVSEALRHEAGQVSLTVARPLFYEAQSRFLVQTRIDGQSYVTLAQASDSDRHFRRAGRALAEFQALGPRIQSIPSPVAWMQEHLQQLVRPAPEFLAAHFPEYRHKIAASLDWILVAQDEWCSQVIPCPLHRDFHLRQLFAKDSQVGLIDWDCFAWGDPAFDVAYFTAYLQSHLPESQVAGATAAFLDGYLTLGSAEVLPRLPVYETFNYLRRACRRLRLQDRDWRQQAERLLCRIHVP